MAHSDGVIDAHDLGDFNPIRPTEHALSQAHHESSVPFFNAIS